MIFGPVPSRRLGFSLGVNNIPPKECSYTCVYCQLGNTLKLSHIRKEYYSTEQIVNAVKEHIAKLGDSVKIDYITFVPDGEPTLDINLGRTISALKNLGIPIAVITNSSLIDIEEVRNELSAADWVSVKVDAVDKQIWHEVDRPHGSLDLDKILNGLLEFSGRFKGKLVTETMLVKGINDTEKNFSQVSAFIKKFNPDKAYITIPTRPPAVGSVLPPDITALNNAYQIFKENNLNVELITGYEGNAFSSTGDFTEDLLNITAVHPMREEAVIELMKKENSDEEVLNKLLKSNRLIKSKYNGKTYYLRNLKFERANFQ